MQHYSLAMFESVLSIPSKSNGLPSCMIRLLNIVATETRDEQSAANKNTISLRLQQ